MRISTALLRRKLLFLLIPSLIGLVYLGSTVLSSSIKKDKSLVKINNLTRSCEVVKAERHQDHVKVVLRNNNDKNITAFVFSSKISATDVFSVKVEFAYSENDFSISPGSTYEKVFGIDSALKAQAYPTLELSAVIFEDKSSEGDALTVQAIENERLAEKIVFIQGLSLLNRMLALSDNELETYLNKDLKEDLSNSLNISQKELMARLITENPRLMINSQTDEIPQSIQTGLQTGKEYVSKKIQYLQTLNQTQGNHSIREEVKRIKQIYEKMINKL